MSLDAAVNQVLKEVPQCLAAGVVDISTGMLMAVRTTDSHPEEVLELVSAATGDLFQGTNVIAIENLFKKIRGVSNEDRYFKEIIVNSEHLIHVFQRGKTKEEIVLVTVTKLSANLGMVLNKSRNALKEIEAAV